jgi:hypothetical protein
LAAFDDAARFACRIARIILFFQRYEHPDKDIILNPHCFRTIDTFKDIIQLSENRIHVTILLLERFFQYGYSLGLGGG